MWCERDKQLQVIELQASRKAGLLESGVRVGVASKGYETLPYGGLRTKVQAKKVHYSCLCRKTYPRKNDDHLHKQDTIF